MTLAAGSRCTSQETAERLATLVVACGAESGPFKGYGAPLGGGKGDGGDAWDSTGFGDQW